MTFTLYWIQICEAATGTIGTWEAHATTHGQGIVQSLNVAVGLVWVCGPIATVLVLMSVAPVTIAG